MSDNSELRVDTSEANRVIASLNAQIEGTKVKIIDLVDETEKRSKEAFKVSLDAMRAGYMVISGMTQAMGGSMSQAFSAMYGIAMAGIMTYQSIAAALLPSPIPGARLMAGLMLASLGTAMAQLGAVSLGQAELASQVGGLNMILQGIGGMINKYGF